MSSSRLIRRGSLERGDVRELALDLLPAPKRGDTFSYPDNFEPIFFEVVGEAAPTALVEEPPPEEAFEAVEIPVEPEIVAEAQLPPQISEEELDRKIQLAFNSGLTEGKNQSEESMAGLCKTLSEAVDSVTTLREKIMREAEEDLLRLSLSIARKIIQQEVSHDRRILAKLVSEAVRNTSEHEEIVIRLNPEDHKVVSSNTRVYLADVGNQRRMSLKADDCIPLGGCVVDTETGTIDARFEAQLEEIYNKLTEERGMVRSKQLREPEERVEGNVDGKN